MKILSYTSPAWGHLHPTVPIMQELQRRGHDIIVHSLAGQVALLRELGFKADAVSADVEAVPMDDYLAESPQKGLKRAVSAFTRRAHFEVPEMQALLASEQPDLLLIDCNCWGAWAVAEQSGLPWAVLQHYPTPLRSPDVPPFGPGVRPLPGRIGRTRNALLRPILDGVLERAFVPPLNEVRALAGADPVHDLHEMIVRPPLTLYLTSTAFEHPRTAWPESFCFIGPVIWEPPAPAPDWLEERNRPLVLVTTSSEFQDDGALIEAALAGLATEDLDVVATAPAGVASGLAVPDNARVEEFVPHSLVLPHAAVAVTHGGMGATQKALASGVPVVVVPWGRDQSEVGRRAERTGAGLLLPKRRLNPARLRDAVRRARTLRPAAEALARAYAEEGGPTLAADRLEALAV